MTQRTRNIIANALLGLTVLFAVTFVVQHFMTQTRPYWHNDLVWLALASVIASDLVRGRFQRTRQKLD
ncbi:MAG: hypothetical protein ABI035_04450 [Gemmatimonadaceae bacterium]